MSVLHHPDGDAQLEPAPAGLTTIRVAGTTCDTRYPPDLVEHVLRVKGPAALCDEIRRDEDPAYVEADLRDGILGFAGPSDFRGARLLDFGCGAGSSAIVLARLLPGVSITGVDIDGACLELARARARHHGLQNVRFVRSDDPRGLPPGLRDFDGVVLSAVYEHLLPGERAAVLTTLWRALRTGGRLFINQLPHRWYPLELHTTGLPLINYLPDRAALRFARAFSRHVSRAETWSDLLRRGIRGGTRAEILRTLRRAGGRPFVLPRRRRVIDPLASRSGGRLRSAAKALVTGLCAMIGAAWGEPIVPVLVLAIEKR